MKAKMRSRLSKYYFLWFGAIVAVFLGVGLTLHPPKAASVAANQCSGNGDTCVVLVVTLTGSGTPPTSGVTVTAKRHAISDNGIAPISIDNTVTLDDQASLPANLNGFQTFANNTKLGAHQFTSYYGIYDTNSNNGGVCAAGGNQAEGTFDITVGGAATGSLNGVNLCTGSPETNGAFIHSVNIPINTASNPSKNGAISGSAQYDNSSTNQTGSCSTDSSIKVVNPTNGNLIEKVSPDNSGNYRTQMDIPPSDYTVELTCYNGPNQAGVEVYGGALIQQTVTANQTTTGVNFCLVGDGTSATGDSLGSASACQPAAGATNNGTNSSQPSCESSGFSLSWIFCPIINGLADASDGIYTSIVQPLLKVDPVNLSSPQSDPSHTYEIWSTFRIYGDIFLVIALLVVVFGESIGGGLIDAYAAKKILPRLLAAAILINLSIYLVALAVDITNILGNGIGALIEAPFKTAACTTANNLATGTPCFALNINGSTGDLGMAALVGGGIWAALAAGPLVEFLLLFVLIPAFLTMLAIVVTVFLRRGLILLLILMSPIAFALYCLPNTEKYFRQWWDLLLKTLLVYPLIAAIFALANVLSVTIDKTSTGGLKTIADFLAIVALFVPLFLIPFSFRLAGGLLGRFHELATQSRKQAHEAIKGNPNDQFSWRNMTRRKLANRTLAQRENVVNRGINMQKSNRSRFGRVMGGGLASVAGFGNYQQKRSIRNKEAADYIQSQTATGNDSSVRAMFARKLDYMRDTGQKDANGNAIMERESGYFGTDTRVANGLATGKSAPDFSEFEVNKARGLMSHDASFYQAGLTYEVGKAGDDDVLDTIRSVNASNIQSSPWLRQESAGIVKGTGFSHQQARREMKHEDLDVGTGTYTRSSRASSREIAENVSNWGLSNMRTSTLKAEQDDYKAARAIVWSSDPNATQEQRLQAASDMAEIRTHKVQPKINGIEDAQEIMRHVESTANSLDMRRQQTGGFALQGEGPDQSVVSGSQTGAAGHVSEEIENLINLAATNRRGVNGNGNGG